MVADPFARRADVHQTDLRLEVIERTLPGDGTSPLAFAVVRARGRIDVAASATPITARLTLQDVTGSAELPDLSGPEGRTSDVKCSVSGLSDAQGWFESITTLTAPSTAWTLQAVEVGRIPTFALTPPHRGRRDLRVALTLMEGQDPFRTIAVGSALLKSRYDPPGYLDWTADQLAGDRHVAVLAAAVAGVDRRIDRSELEALHRFFRRRYQGRPDVEELRARINSTVDQVFDRLRSNSADPGRLFVEATEALRREHDVDLRRVAYELCVRIALADSAYAPEEQEVLAGVPAALDLSNADQRAVRASLQAEHAVLTAA